MLTIGNSSFGEGDFRNGSGFSLGEKFEALGTSFLYLFDAESCSVGSPPSDVVSEDTSDAYEIVDIGLSIGKVLRKKVANTTTKRCFFNSYNTFLVPVKATFYFYLTSVATTLTLFGTNLVNAANSGGGPTGIEFDAGSGSLKHNGRLANTNAGFVSAQGALDLDSGGYAYLQSMSANVLYKAECRINSGNNKQRMKIAVSGTDSRGHTTENDFPKAQNRIGFLDGSGTVPQAYIKRVEVVELT